MLILVSRYGHCLNDLLFRAATGWLPVEIAAVVSNHPNLGRLADNHDLPFHHVPVTAATKPAAEARLLALIDHYDVNLVVLARYMQVLSARLCATLAGRAINIHHSRASRALGRITRPTIGGSSSSVPPPTTSPLTSTRGPSSSSRWPGSPTR